MAELVRRGVELLLGTRAPEADKRLRQRALAAAGRFASGCGDLSEAHDRYLEEAFDKPPASALEPDEVQDPSIMRPAIS